MGARRIIWVPKCLPGNRLRRKLESEIDKTPTNVTARALRRVFCLTVVLFAIWRFSENTADPDLWGHVIFGQRMIHMGHVEKAEPFSWTAPQYEWINHEVGAELAMGATHLAMGGPGLLLLAVATGLFTFFLALRLATAHSKMPLVAWGIGLLAAKEIAYGFSVRPQIFTAVAFVLMLWLLRKIHEGKMWFAVALPPLFLVWINTHGGALAGIAILFLVAGMAVFQPLVYKCAPRLAEYVENSSWKLPSVLIPTAALSLGALFINPWGAELIRWLIGSVMWFRPEISEWNPPAFGAEHAALFALVPISAFAFLFSRKKRWLWEMAVVGGLAVVALRHVRHVPLFSIAALALVPPHLADALDRFKNQFENLRIAFSRSSVQRSACGLLIVLSVAMAVATVTYKKEKFYTIEVPRDEYPLNAIEFVRTNGISGKQISFFDWGEQSIWELPDSPVSIDGRLDTCYPRSLLTEHWKFFDGKPVDAKVFDIDAADYAILRTDVVGLTTLKNSTNWAAVYEDPLTVVFVRDIDRFPSLSKLQLPVRSSREALAARSPFPDKPSRNSR